MLFIYGTNFIIQVERLERKMKKEVCHIVNKSNTVEIEIGIYIYIYIWLNNNNHDKFCTFWNSLG